MNKKRRTIPLGLRIRVLERDGFRCRYCGRTPKFVELHVDHITPVSAGGSDAIENLATACIECNLGKGARTDIRPIHATNEKDEPQGQQWGVWFSDGQIAYAGKIIGYVNDDFVSVNLIEWFGHTLSGNIETLALPAAFVFGSEERAAEFCNSPELWPRLVLV